VQRVVQTCADALFKNLYNKINLREKACETCKFLVQVDFFKQRNYTGRLTLEIQQQVSHVKLCFEETLKVIMPVWSVWPQCGPVSRVTSTVDEHSCAVPLSTHENNRSTFIGDLFSKPTSGTSTSCPNYFGYILFVLRNVIRGVVLCVSPSSASVCLSVCLFIYRGVGSNLRVVAQGHRGSAST